jgi:SAM-dependent methyltransferase
MTIYRNFHTAYIASRRARIIKDAFLDILPQHEIHENWLDIGSREGKITQAIHESAKGKIARVQTLDVYGVPNPIFKPIIYDGWTIPFSDCSFDLVSFIDTLHHVKDVAHLLAEAKRITKKYIVIKDHKYLTAWQLKLLKIQDWFGNVNTGCPLTYNFLRYNEWQSIFASLKLRAVRSEESIDFKYPFPFNTLYPNCLHFICLLEK